jgi:ribosomal protein S18 acetylase RimI-like enzyme
MDPIRFRYDLALDQTMMFEDVYPEPLQLDLEEKQELWDTAGSIFVWMFVGAEIVGESYGIPLATIHREVEGLQDLSAPDRESSIYCHSNTILPAFQHRGFGTILKSHWLGLVAAAGFKSVYGHARPGRSQKLNARFGAEFVESFPDWYGTQEEYRLYRLALR